MVLPLSVDFSDGSVCFPMDQLVQVRRMGDLMDVVSEMEHHDSAPRESNSSHANREDFPC